jgi:hypothetical protein
VRALPRATSAEIGGRVGGAFQQHQVAGIVDDDDRHFPFVARCLGFARVHRLVRIVERQA